MIIAMALSLWILTFSTIYFSPIYCSNRPLISRIAFGSCANQSDSQPIWRAISNFDPQIFIWLGDNIYGDNRRPYKLFGKERTIGPWKNAPRFVPSSADEMKTKYKMEKLNPDYAHLRDSTMVIGTWDDHDYGLNDAGKEFEAKVTNQRLLLDFLDEPVDSPRRKQAGVYASYVFGPEEKEIKVILLDTRYHRDPLGSDGNILGNEQWIWLEKELSGPPTALTIIGSSIQVISNLSAMVGPVFRLESWGNFPKERSRLFRLINDTKRDGVLFISGDVHFGEITRYDCATGYPLYDVTSSGLTQAIEKAVPFPFDILIKLFACLIPSTMRVMDQSCRHSSCIYGQPNFGAVEIDWSANPVNLKIEVRDVTGSPAIKINFPLSELNSNRMHSGFTYKAGHQKFCSLEIRSPWITRYRFVLIFIFMLATVVVALIGAAWFTVMLSRRYLWKCKYD